MIFHSCVFAGRRVTRFGNTVIRWWVSSSAAIDCRAQYCTRQALVSCIQIFMLSVAMRPHDSCCASVTSIRPGILFGILQIYMKHILFDLFLYGISIPLCVCVRACVWPAGCCIVLWSYCEDRFLNGFKPENRYWCILTLEYRTDKWPLDVLPNVVL